MPIGGVVYTVLSNICSQRRRLKTILNAGETPSCSTHLVASGDNFSRFLCSIRSQWWHLGDLPEPW
ncbi:hypothetical protein BD311DRAFT_757431 [Dichomitus squalens]|uniref:Uncharacterized protein n=1 Tax=Dichomitus squalens TaxID=114155 RepID=A0A4Q9MMT4_9APHY|nr:hypothetical protein BD311DRAFT_757431 [Dichomitus squalens]